ncbi:MAG: hypothetical protein KDA93_00555 [Planctomycetaceae bacterium]|nr:hypothetical protein [Planctomycetaceae bacterium]
MKLNRQQLLLIVLAGFGVLQAGDWALTNMIQGPLDQRRNRGKAMERERDKLKQTLTDGRKAGQMLADFRKQSLPENTEVARSLYRSWLLERVNEAGLQSPTVDSRSPSKRGGYRVLPFSMRARGSLDQFVQFMFDFSEAGLLHRVQSLDLNPAGSTGQFDITLNIETLMVPGANGVALNTDSSDWLVSDSMTDYQVISRRNIFGIGMAEDPRRQSFVTAITRSNGQPQVWFKLRGDDKTLKVGEGDTISVDDFHGTIAEISTQEVSIDADGKRWHLSVGDSLADGSAVQSDP